MKCDNWINPNKTGKRGQLLRSAFLGTRDVKDADVKFGGEAQICNGAIVAAIRIVNEPEWGGTSAVMEIDYRCDRCGELLYGPEFPQGSEEVARILAAFIAYKVIEGAAKGREG